VSSISRPSRMDSNGIRATKGPKRVVKKGVVKEKKNVL
jgi:hypothetical protein